jgi:hypothetical protein
MRRKIAAIAAFALLAGAGCPNKSGPKGPGAGDGGDPVADRRCDAQRAHIQQLYEQATTADKPELAADLLEANVAMVMADCAEQPARAAPCIEQAKTAADIERDCLIPLDDEGTVEGNKFGSKP